MRILIIWKPKTGEENRGDFRKKRKKGPRGVKIKKIEKRGKIKNDIV